MYFPFVLLALVIVSAVFLLRQFWTRSLDVIDEPPADGALNARDEASHDVLKAA
jgi:hypothetical protein